MRSTTQRWILGALALGLVLPMAGTGLGAQTSSPGANRAQPDAKSSVRKLPPPHVGYVETGPLRIDRIYPSMEGPSERVAMNADQIDWITSFRTDVIDTATNEVMGDEFFCHSQLQLTDTTRLMVAATGSNEIRFPPGFGMPVSKIRRGMPEDLRHISFLGMVLNNHETEIDRLTRVRGTIEFYRDADLGPTKSLRSLYKVGLAMTVKDLDEYKPSEGHQVSDDLATHCVLVEGLKGHWIVPPGHQVTRRVFDAIVPVKSTVHTIAAHLHNHGDYLRLTDVTTGKTLYQTDVIYEKDRKQIAKIPAYSSVQGFTIYPDHEYQIEASYTNRTDHDVDAMAVMDLYYHPTNDASITYATD